jgi:hypothetical protein
MSKMVVAVVVGLVLTCSAQLARADAKAPRSETCLDKCDFVFEKCQAAESSKKHGSRCNIEAVRCKQDCPAEPVEDSRVPTDRSHRKCVDGCRATYKACLGRAENKGGGSCAGDDVRCEKACPKPLPAMVTGPSSTGPGGAPSSAPLAPPVEAKPKKPRAAARVEGAAAPAPASATPAATLGERGDTAPTVRSEAVAAPTKAPAEASDTAVYPSGSDRGFFGRIKCFFVACEREASTPCLTQCATAYDECRVRESKRGGECSTRLMNCRQSCSSGAR